jgi:predicted transcriptional regulator of viral defense system
MDLVLHRLAKKGTLRRLVRGLYDYPRTDPDIGLVSPTTDAIVKSLKGRDNILLQPSGGYAANLLGLSDQVPMKIVFLTDGPTRRVQLGKQVIMLKHTTPRAGPDFPVITMTSGA